MKKHTNTTARASLKEKYQLAGRTYIRAWHALLIVGLVAGLAWGVVVANRSGETENTAAAISATSGDGIEKAAYSAHGPINAPPLFHAVSPPSDAAREEAGRRSLQPVSLSLKLAKDVYELDEYLSGTGSVTNPNSVPVAAKVNIELLKGTTVVKKTTLDFPCDKQTDAPTCVPTGTTPINPADILVVLTKLDRIPADPALLGPWTLAITPTSAGITGKRIALPFRVVMPRAVTMTVDGGSNRGTVGLLHGFVIPPQPSSDITKRLMSALKPQAWRVWFEREAPEIFQYHPKKFTLSTEGDYYYVACAERERQLGRQIPECHSENPAIFLPVILPWENDYALYKEYIAGRARNAMTIKNPEVYLGWWNEPNFPGIGQNFGTNKQMFDTFKVFHKTIRDINPKQKIEGPTAMVFDEPFMRAFLDYVADNDLQLDAVSWHEWAPDYIDEHVRTVRKWFSENPRYCTPKCPEIHINEFNAIPHYFIPGWQGAYHANFENSGIDAAAGNGCFIMGLPGGQKINTCYNNYMGLFIEQNGRHNEVPQPNYWVHRAYADMHDMTKLAVSSTAERTVAMAGKSDADKTIRLVVSRYSCGKTGSWCVNTGVFNSLNGEKAPPIPVTVTVAGYPYAASGALVQAEIYRIPNENVPGAFTEANLEKQKIVQTLAVNANGNVVVNTPSFQDGDVYYITIKLKAPPLTVLFPNGGEQFEVGQSAEVPIRWSALCTTGPTFTAALYKSGTLVHTMSSSTPARNCLPGQTTTAYSVSGRIPATLPAGTDYTARVSVTRDRNIFDESDKPFTIAARKIVTLSAEPASLVRGQGSFTVDWDATGITTSKRDWIGIFKVGDANENYGQWFYTNGEKKGTLTFRSSIAPGEYEFRYLLDDGYVDVARSGKVAVTQSSSVLLSPGNPLVSPEQALLLVVPGPEASKITTANRKKLVEDRAVESVVLDITKCEVDPLVLKVRRGEDILVRNHDAATEHILFVDSVRRVIIPKSGSVKIGVDVYGERLGAVDYKCYKPDATTLSFSASGIILVVE